MQGEIKWNRHKGQRTADKGCRECVDRGEQTVGTKCQLGFHSWLNCSAFALLIDLFELWFGRRPLLCIHLPLTAAPATPPAASVSPEEIVAAIQLGLPAEAFVRQRLQALAASDAGRVPGPLEHVEQKFVQYRLIAASTRIANADRRLAATCRRERRVSIIWNVVNLKLNLKLLQNERRDVHLYI